MSLPLQHYDRPGDRARLHRQIDGRPILIVEGESDKRFLSRVLGRTHGEVFIGGTRNVVLEAAKDVHQHGLQQCACIVDRDFDDEVASVECDPVPLAVYDGADLEYMLLMGPAFDAMMQELGSEKKLDRLGGIDAIRGAALSAAQPMACIRRGNAIHGWGIDFDSVDLARRVDRATLKLDVSGLLDAVFTAAGGRISRDALADCESDPPVCPQTDRVLVRGRDALAVVGVALRKVAGSITHAESNPRRLADILRLSADRSAVEDTAWLQALIKLV